MLNNFSRLVSISHSTLSSNIPLKTAGEYLIFKTGENKHASLRLPYLSAVRCPGRPLFRWGALHSQQLGPGSLQHVRFNVSDLDLALIHVFLLRDGTGQLLWNWYKWWLCGCAFGNKDLLLFSFSTKLHPTIVSLNWRKHLHLQLNGVLLVWAVTIVSFVSFVS